MYMYISERQMEFELRKRNDARGELERFEPDPVVCSFLIGSHCFPKNVTFHLAAKEIALNIKVLESNVFCKKKL